MKSFCTTILRNQGLLFAAAMVAAMAGCDVIKGDYKDPVPVAPIDTTNTDTTAVRKVLLEEFTGHQCGWCPGGTDQAQALKNLYGDRLVLLSIHAGFFSRTSPAPFTYEFRTPAGNEIATYYKIDDRGTPNGVVNRKNDQVVPHASWGGEVSTELQKPANVRLTLSPTINSDTRQLSLTVAAKYVKPEAQPQNLAVYLVETDFVKWQKDYRLPNGSQNIENYKHKDFLRAALTPAFGESFTTAAVPAGHQVSKQYTFQVPQEYDLSKCRIIALTSNTATKVVTQVEESGYLQP